MRVSGSTALPRGAILTLTTQLYHGITMCRVSARDMRWGDWNGCTRWSCTVTTVPQLPELRVERGSVQRTHPPESDPID
jgi:hypothetical protein